MANYFFYFRSVEKTIMQIFEQSRILNNNPIITLTLTITLTLILIVTLTVTLTVTLILTISLRLSSLLILSIKLTQTLTQLRQKDREELAESVRIKNRVYLKLLEMSLFKYLGVAKYEVFRKPGLFLPKA